MYLCYQQIAQIEVKPEREAAQMYYLQLLPTELHDMVRLYLSFADAKLLLGEDARAWQLWIRHRVPTGAYVLDDYHIGTGEHYPDGEKEFLHLDYLLGTAVQNDFPCFEAFIPHISPEVAGRLLFQAAQYNSMKSAQSLLRIYPEAGQYRAPYSGRSPMHEAGSCGSVQVLKLLLEAGLDKEPRAGEGETPLLSAAFYGYPRAIRALLDAGCDASATDDFGNTALHRLALLCRSCDDDLVRRDKWGCVRELRKRGANGHAANKNGQTARQILVDAISGPEIPASVRSGYRASLHVFDIATGRFDVVYPL